MPIYQADWIGHGVTLLTPSADGATGEPIMTDGAGALSFAAGVVLSGGNIGIPNDTGLFYSGAAGTTDYTWGWDGDDAVHTITAGEFVFTGGTVAVSGRLTASDIVTPTAYIGVIKTRGSTYDLVFQLRNADDEKDYIFKNNAGDSLVTISGNANVLVNDPSGHEQLTVRASTAIAAAAADGGNTGLDDLTSGGTFTGYAVTNYRIEIDGGDPANPNTFKWSDDNGATWDVETVAVTGAAQTLNNGVTITFGATTGHDTTDFWIFATSVEQPLLLEDESGNALVTVLNNGNIGTPNDTGLFFSGAAGTTDYTWGWDGDDAVHTITAGSFVFTGGSIEVDERMTISGPTPILVLKDSTYAGDVSLGFIEWRDLNNTRLGFFGNSSSGNDDLLWKNESSGGHIGIQTTGGGEVQVLANVDLDGMGLFRDKLKFTQDDGNEYIDSLNDGYMDYGATTAHRFNNIVVLPKASGQGIQVDTAAPAFGWRDLLGQIITKGVGASDPDWAVYRGSLRQYKFADGHVHEAWINYHIPHDYVLGTDLYIHVHWSQITVDAGGAAGAPGNVKWYFDFSYADGHGTAGGAADPFIAPLTQSVIQQGSTTQYGQMIAEVAITNNGGDGTHLDRATLLPDGVIQLRVYRSNADGADTLDVEPFVHFTDAHYQSTNIGTKAKAPDFYT